MSDFDPNIDNGGYKFATWIGGLKPKFQIHTTRAAALGKISGSARYYTSFCMFEWQNRSWEPLLRQDVKPTTCSLCLQPPDPDARRGLKFQLDTRKWQGCSPSALSVAVQGM